MLLRIIGLASVFKNVEFFSIAQSVVNIAQNASGVDAGTVNFVGFFKKSLRLLEVWCEFFQEFCGRFFGVVVDKLQCCKVVAAPHIKIGLIGSGANSTALR